MATIIKRTEQARGCGYRKKGGMYLVSGSIGLPCCILPHALTVCPCCGEGVKQSRGFTWVTRGIFADHKPFGSYCDLPGKTCPMFSQEKFGLMWVGEKYYKSGMDFSHEASHMGVSKRIAQIPNDLKIGETWILLAHPKVILRYINPKIGTPAQEQWTPGIFQAFKPTAIEYIVKGGETMEELDKLEKRGLTLIDVTRDVDMQGQFFSEDK